MESRQVLSQNRGRPINRREYTPSLALREPLYLCIKQRRLSHGLAWLLLHLGQRRGQGFLDMHRRRLVVLLLLLLLLGL